MDAINDFSSLRTKNFHLLNSTYIPLIPKKKGAHDINNFRPISPIHAIAKERCKNDGPKAFPI
jgi:hypothetical protein